MTRRREILRHLRGLGEISEIMGAMRNLALLETRKLSRSVAAQGRVVASIREATHELLIAYPELHDDPTLPPNVLLLIGSERGFCGDFNRSLVSALAAQSLEVSGAPVVVIGSRLASRLPEDRPPLASLPGATTGAEIPSVILNLVRTLRAWRDASGAGAQMRPLVLHHGTATAILATALDPTTDLDAGARPGGCPPLTGLPPATLLERLSDHYLYAVLHQIFYGSLLAENERRMRHMDRAIRHIGEQCERLRRRSNALRQEEITEEIEVITLSARPCET